MYCLFHGTKSANITLGPSCNNKSYTKAQKRNKGFARYSEIIIMKNLARFEPTNNILTLFPNINKLIISYRIVPLYK